MNMDSPDFVMAKRLLDDLKLCGFKFQRSSLLRHRADSRKLRVPRDSMLFVTTCRHSVERAEGDSS